ncbi:MAG: YitT family protein [Firmicutes bacterium]|nr:YitT family protein [Bacillota bacterium]MBQ1430740.1 YitT family protein [Bacillota bacterium]MBQ1735431.1 YitT family protein [Lachnospiraceae bacterium]MBQ2305221.1 YitT family protein [Bacillota bacterium]
MKENTKLKDSKIVKTLIKYAALTLAACVFAFNLKSFIRTGNLIPGGFSGITVLVQQIGRQFFGVEIPYSVIYLPLNVIPAYIGIRYIGKFFTLESFYVVVLSSILTDIFPNITITYEPILIAIFAGIVGGIGSVICLTAGASGGGTDFISIYFSEKKGIDAWGYILAGNIVLLVAAGLLFDFDRALYSIIYQYVITTILGTYYKRYQQDTLLVVTAYPKEIIARIYEMTKHDATIIQGEGGYSGEAKNILYSVVGRDQSDKVIKAIKEIDPGAFTNVIKTEQVNGRFYMRPKK